MKKYIPKTKDDLEAIELLKSCSITEIKEDGNVYKLLECMQDMHWEIAHEIVKYFTPYNKDIEPDLIKILNSNDDEWKFSMLFCLINESKEKLGEDLMIVINRIAEAPTEGEIIEELNIKAKEIIKKMK